MLYDPESTESNVRKRKDFLVYQDTVHITRNANHNNKNIDCSKYLSVGD